MFLKNIKSIRAIFFLAMMNLFMFFSVAAAQFTTNGGPNTLRNDPLDEILEDVIVGILGFIGVTGILYLVYGGIRYVTSAGDETVMEEAKTVITYAIWGLFLTAAAYAIVKTVVTIVG